MGHFAVLVHAPAGFSSLEFNEFYFSDGVGDTPFSSFGTGDDGKNDKVGSYDGEGDEGAVFFVFVECGATSLILAIQ